MATSLSGGLPYNRRTGGAIGNNQTGASQLQGNTIPKGYQLGELQNWKPEQMQLFQQLLGHVGQDSHLSKLASGDQSYFDQLERPALEQFSGLQGNLASRFSGAGSFGGRHSSGHQNAQGAQAQNFAQQLQSNRMNLQRQALNDLFSMSSNLLGQRPSEQFLIKNAEEQRPWWQDLLIGAGSGIGQGLGSGLAGAATGGLSALGPLLQKLFSQQQQQQQGV